VDHTTCKANVNVESQSVVLTVPLGWTINTFSNPPIGSSVHAGSTVKFHYFLSNGGNRTDTLCFQVTYKDSIAPKINTSLSSPAVPCTSANYRAWWEAQIDSLETTSTDTCNIDTIYHNGPLDTFLLCGTVNLVFTVRDSSGNVADKVASYTFVDNVKPQFFGIPKDTTIACGDAIPPAPAPGTVTATDNCSALPINHRIVYGGETSTRTTGTGLCTDFGYVIRRTWSVTDSCGNRRDSTWTINVVDNVAPTFSVPSDVTIDCSADTSRTALGDITAILENCDPNRVVTFNQTISTGTCPIKYTITRTWTVRDACNNQTTKSQVISVRDTIKPSGVFPPDITVDCGNANRLEVTGVPVSLNDNCTPVPTYIKGPDTLQAGSCPSNYTIRRPWIIRDACGNEISQLQVITVVDSFPPRILSAARDTILNCTSNADDAFASWLAMKGRAVASDNCTPTDSLTWQMFKFGTNDPPSLPSPDCGNMPQGIYRQAKVKFVVTDKCGGIDSTSATFTVRDDSPPTVICPSDMLLNPPTGTCEINELVPWPIVTDNCNNAVDTVNITIPKKLFTNQPGDVNETPVDSMVFEFSVSGPPSSAASNATLTIKMIKTDAEEPTEYLNVFGENGFFLDRLPNTSAQCGDATKIFTLTPTQINSWAIDGKIRITLKPNIPQGMPGRFAVNNICPDGGIEASLNFVRNRPNNLVFEYSLNGGPRVSSSVPVTLPLGAHNASYFFIDCANNETVCNFKVTVEDKELPRLLCPPNVTINTAPGFCTTDVDVPLYVSVTDNCGIVDPTQQTQPATTSASRFITYNYNPNLTDWIANDKTFVFKGLPANATPGNVEIIISFKGDMESVGEYFSIFDNDNVLLGTTQVGQLNVTPGNCTTEGKAVFTVSAAKFNQWASGDSIKIRAVSNISFAIPPAGVGSGINPCNPAKVVNNGDIDSVSYIYATIRYESARPKFWGTGANVFDTLQLDPPLQPRKLALKRGRTTFTYSITDKNGNTGSCSFDVNVQDVEKPIAKCGPTFININPSGFIVDTIFPSLINIGSSDNCGIASMTVTPSTVTCNQAGVLPVYLVVRDSSGNTDTCRTFVNVSTIQPSPTVLTRCTGTSIQLFANPPASPGGSTTVFKFTWKNPAGVVFSFDRNPIIQNVGPQTVGFYVVEIEGLTGCKSSASVQVTCEMLPLQKPVLSAVSNTICIENDINLSTDAVCGATTKYKWYSGTAPSGTLLQTTTVPTFTNRPSTPGTYSFYVVVERDTCTSEVSNSISVLVHPKPVAIPEFSDTSICAGQPLLLKTINTPLTATCYWTGPCGFESFKCNPDLIGAATVCNSGLYQVIVTNNNCASDPAFVAVNVIELPKQPTLINSTSANSPTCQGSSVTLTASAVQSAVSYQWTTPTLQIISTPTNVLTINQANAAEHGGQWTVKIIGNPCESLPSSATFVYIATPPTSLTASATPATVCEGQNIQLSATSASPNVTFHWSYPNGLTSALQNPLIANVSTANKGNYILRVTNEFGCSRNDTVAVEVFGRVKINGGSSNVPTCVTGPVNVNILALLFPPDPGNYSYLWTGPNGYSSVEDTATISNGTIANSGPYTLVVTNDKGCSSLPFTVNVAIPAIPPTPSSPMLSAPNPFCIGDNATLTTSPFQGSNAVYLWKKPSGEEETTSFPSLALSSLSRNDSGAYSVRYVINGCQSSASGLSTLTVNPIPEANLTAPATVCEGQELKLGVQCTSGATYEWTGPGGFSSSVCNPVITSANPNLHSGTYSVRRRLNGCWSATVRADVLVKPRPVIPTALNAGPYCGNTENAVLSISPNTATPGASYHWYNSIGNPLGESTTLLNFNIPNPLSYGNGSNEFYVIATLDGCNSLPSVPTLVRFNSIPTNVAEAGPDIKACEGDIVTLKATPVTIGTGLWTIIGEAGGVTIANPDNATTTATGLAPAKTYKFRWTLSNGACKNYSFDTTLVAVDKKETAEAGESVVACHTTVATLKAVAPTSGTGLWTQSQAQQLLGVTITNPSNPSTTVSGMLPGNNYVFTWTITNNCGSSSDAVQVKVTNEDAFAGTDFNECGDGCLKLNGTGALSGVGMWTSPDPNLRFATPTDPKTNVCNLKVGTNILVWTIDRGVCGHFSVDTVVIGYQYAPELQDDQLNIPFNAKGSVNILSNDKILGSYNLVISKQPEFGTVTFDQTGALTYVPSRAYVGRDVITYQVCIDNCRCISANVNIIVGDKAECQPPSIITPNKDGMNDAFIIPCMGNGTLYPRSRVSIFNQWGDEVFRAAPYKNDWEGTYDGQDLPAGTYFYILDFGTGDKPTSGYLILQR
jgi:gliding motility-associated-like protein